MITETTEEHVAPQLPFDETSPEPDTQAGGRLILAIVLLIAVLVVTVLLLAGLYSSSVADTRSSAQDFRLTQVNSANAAFLDDYREYDPVDDQVKLYQIPVARAQQILIENPSYLAHMPGTSLNTSVPVSDIQLPIPPSLPQENAAAVNSAQADEAPSTEDEAVAPTTDSEASE